jgi:ATP-binding cassette subfamily B protein
MRQSSLSLLLSLWNHLNHYRRRQFVFMLCLTAVTSAIEVVSMSAILPFIGILTQPEKVYSSSWMRVPIDLLGIQSSADLILPLTVGFIFLALLAGFLRLLLLYTSVKLGKEIGVDLSTEVYRRTLYQPYSIHIARSSSEIISGITQKTATAARVIVSMISVVTSSTLFIVIMSTMLIVDPIVGILGAVSFGFVYAVIAWVTNRRLMRNSIYIAEAQTLVIKALQEGLGAIRDVLLDGVQSIYCAVFGIASLKLQRAEGENTFINQAPRYALEAIGMVLIAVLILFLSRDSGGLLYSLPMLALLALGAQRLLPLMQQLYGNWSEVAGNSAVLLDVLALLAQPLPVHAEFPEIDALVFKDSIRFNNVSFRYRNDLPLVVNGFNLVIPKGKRIGIIGGTGSGKSTTLDLLMGLLASTEGQILIDGQILDDSNRGGWQRAIAHVPQHIFLADSTIAENIAFGVPLEEINYSAMREAAQKARISDFIESRPESYQAVIGERGVRLSGGQRQRIGIARALYKNASVVILDEATSALDTDTEIAIMETVERLDKNLTIIMVAHRHSTLKGCDTIYQMEKGAIVGQYSYKQLVSKIA